MPKDQQTQHERNGSPLIGGRAIVVLTLIGVVFACVLLARGQGGPWASRVAGVVFTLLGSGWQPLVYLLGAVGIGRIVRPMLGDCQSRWAIELGAGLTLTLALTHLLGVLGLLSTLSAWGVTGLGLGLLALDLRRANTHGFGAVRIDPLTAVIACGVSLALVMACNPPGVLWGSEYGGFDALSYHLQLPREWIEQGRIWPSEHNVYSFLPGYVEGAYAHLALLNGGGMLERHASAAMSAQLLSAMMLVAGAFAIGELSRAFMTRVLPDRDDRTAGRLAMLLTLCTPWMVVVGTIAYNEAAVVLLGACALLVAMLPIAPLNRGVLCGLIVGGACCCKPTALFLLAPSVGIVLLACSPFKRWLPAAMACVLVGSLTIAPWLIRNELATGNPVFPQLTGFFGEGHWSEAQHAIYAGAHHFEGSITDRVRLLVLPDPGGLDHVSRFRGITNAQWGLLPLLATVGLVSLLFTRTTRRAGLIALLTLMVPLAAWLMLTHIQSRFLIPLTPILCVLGSVAVARIASEIARRSIARVLAVMLGLQAGGFAMLQNNGNPFTLIDLGAGFSMGAYEFESLPWVPALNRMTAEDDTIYLMGDATPFFIIRDVRYNTVYDRWLIEDAIEQHPDEPERWTQTLRDEGIDVVVVSFTEIDRYARSGWLPPTIDPQRLIEWIDSLGEPIEVWSDRAGNPVRAVFRITPPSP
ncbi:MAG: hypothetical protein KDA29_02660 [Phycisphaerales bacterium]|nr:hypothetical protein [Phycisphaerales bacterium]